MPDDDDSPTGRDISTLSAGQLDDRRDREELRTRYYGLLQELRVVLPGTQVLVAFLLTVPFNNRFTELDDVGDRLYGASLGLGTLAIICLIAPTAFHRLGHRQSRSRRLQWSIRLTRIGMVFLGASLVAALTLVTRFVFGDAPAVVVTVVTGSALVFAWYVLPRMTSGPHRTAD